MKTRGSDILKNLQRCLNFKHSVCLMISCFTVSAFAQTEYVSKRNETISRKPAAIEEEVLTVPLASNDSFFTNENMFAEDDAGVMKDLKASLNNWEEIEDFAKRWNLESTNLYKTPTATQKGQYIAKKMLRYADKRLSGEMKRADEGSTLHTMGKVEKNLRPNASVNVSKNFGFKFKARVLQGKAIMDVKNPWVECNLTVSANGRAKFATRKELKDLGFASGAEYSLNDSQFLTYMDQRITDNIKARVSNTSGPTNDSRLEMLASFPFNF